MRFIQRHEAEGSWRCFIEKEVSSGGYGQIILYYR